VKAKIEQITQRTYEVPYIDNIMDITNVQFKQPKLKGFDYEIDAQTNMQFNFSAISDFLDVLTTSINNLSTNVVSVANASTNTLGEVANEAMNITQECINDPSKCKDAAKQ
jgi:hypothetical protein